MGRGRICALRLLALEQIADILTRESLVFDQRARHGLELIALFAEDSARFREAVFHETAHFGVDLARRRLGNVLLTADLHTEEDLVAVLAVRDRAELFREAPACHHHLGETGGLVDVRLRAGRDLVAPEDHLLGDATAHHDREARRHLLEGHRQFVVLRQLHDHA